jgi:prepilin-type N-terminal cleavage/methylation domain-containing protein
MRTNTSCLQYSFKGGFTLLEILVAIAILTLIAGTVFGPLSRFRTQKTLDAAVEVTLAAFTRAHFDSISSLNDMQYGVHLDAGQAVHFVGITYDASAPTNVVYSIPANVEIANVTLAGGGTDVVFQRLNGGTPHSGTFLIRATADPSISALVTVHATGAVSL